MTLDSKLADLLANFCLDIAKAYFIAAFVTPPLSTGSVLATILVEVQDLTKNCHSERSEESQD